MIEIKPLPHCEATISLPGSKSYTHRALLVSALAEGESVLINALRSEDTEHTALALETFGVPITWEGDSIRVLGGRGKLKKGDERIYVGNSGTSMRFLTALAALRNGRTVLYGSGRMKRRPIIDLLDGLIALGTKAYSQEKGGYPPVVVEGRGLRGGTARIKGDKSSQFLSALLMVAPYAREDIHIEVEGQLVSRPYIGVTLDVMSAFGVEVKNEEDRSFFLRAGQRYLPQTYRIEGDASNASYFFSAAAITKGKVRVENFSPTSIQGDARFLDILEKMGCKVVRGVGWAAVYGKQLRGMEIDMSMMPDLVPTLAVTAAFVRGKTVIKNIGHLRFKESDRVRTLACGLTKMGIRVEEGMDWLRIEGGGAQGAEIETHNDHRLAMSFAIAGLVVSGIKIKGQRCVEKSFPQFWEKFQKLYSLSPIPLPRVRGRGIG